MATKKAVVKKGKSEPKPVAKKPAKAPKAIKHKSLRAALFGLQGEQIQIPKRGVGTINGRQYAYPLIDDLLTHTRPFLQKHGLGFTQMGASNKLVTTVFHVDSDESDVSELDLGTGLSSQELGARITYLRRYMYSAAFGFPNEDIDGAKGGLQTAPAEATKPVTPPAQVAGQQSVPPDQAIGRGPTNVQNVPAKPEDTIRVDEMMNGGEAAKSENFLKAEGAVASAQSPEAIEKLGKQIAGSVRLVEGEKKILLAQLQEKHDKIMEPIQRGK